MKLLDTNNFLILACNFRNKNVGGCTEHVSLIDNYGTRPIWITHLQSSKHKSFV